MNENTTGSTSEVVYEFSRIAQIDGWWLWTFILGVTVAAFVVGVKWYRRDVGELQRPIRWTLLTMRLVAAIAVVFFLADLQRRTQRYVTRPSEVVVMVDTSQSMSLPAGNASPGPSRIQRVRSLIDDSDMVGKLGQSHRVSVYAFDSADAPELLHTRGPGKPQPDTQDSSTQDSSTQDSSTQDRPPSADSPARRDAGTPRTTSAGAFRVYAGVLFLAFGGAGLLVALVMGAIGRGGQAGWLVFGASTCVVLGIGWVGGLYTVDANRSVFDRWGWSMAETDRSAAASDFGPSGEPDDETSHDDATVASEMSGRPAVSGEAEQFESSSASTNPTDWRDRIAAAGGRSRIGDSLRGVLADHDASTLAGVVLLTDGQNNGGADTTSAATAARRVEVALYPVGLGSDMSPPNVKVVDLEAPKRVYPGDKFAVNAVLQSSGQATKTVEVQLIDGVVGDAGEGDGPGLDDPSGAVTPSGNSIAGVTSGRIVDRRKVELKSDGSLQGVRFEIEPDSVGKRRLAVRVVGGTADQNPADNIAGANYEVVARRLRVLAIAGGPTREYRFVRNLFHRDRSITLDVWLQTGQPGMSQDASTLLPDFPDTADELFEYDAIVMFDPDWTRISMSALDLVDRWLAEQAGGLVIVAGPVFHNKWSRRRTDPRVSRIAGFFPVEVSSRGPLLGGGRQGGRNAWAIQFTPDARRAEFLWIEDAPGPSFDVWNDFEGVYDYVGIKDAKPGASVYGRFSDPTTDLGDGLPIYLASQFYGAGRVMFQGSGEMWRLRGLSDAYFDAYYTKLVRWVSEGRLLRDSTRGVLRVDNTRATVGDTLNVRAILSDEQFRPLVVPSVEARLVLPGGQIVALELKPVVGESRGGVYSGRFVARVPGDHEIELPVGGSLSTELLRQSVAIRVPTLELERPIRSDVDLREMATLTGGVYLPVDPSVTATALTNELTRRIQPQPQTSVLPGTPDRDFTFRRNAVLMALMMIVLTLEWTLRRLHRLA